METAIYTGSEFENGVVQDRVTIYLRTGMARPPYREYKSTKDVSLFLGNVRTFLPDALVMTI